MLNGIDIRSRVEKLDKLSAGWRAFSPNIAGEGKNVSRNHDLDSVDGGNWHEAEIRFHSPRVEFSWRVCARAPNWHGRDGSFTTVSRRNFHGEAGLVLLEERLKGPLYGTGHARFFPFPSRIARFRSPSASLPSSPCSTSAEVGHLDRGRSRGQRGLNLLYSMHRG